MIIYPYRAKFTWKKARVGVSLLGQAAICFISCDTMILIELMMEAGLITQPILAALILNLQQVSLCAKIFPGFSLKFEDIRLPFPTLNICFP